MAIINVIGTRTMDFIRVGAMNDTYESKFTGIGRPVDVIIQGNKIFLNSDVTFTAVPNRDGIGFRLYSGQSTRDNPQPLRVKLINADQPTPDWVEEPVPLNLF